MNFLKSLVVAGILLFAGVYFGSNYAVSKVFEQWLGVPVSVQSVRWGFSKHHFIAQKVSFKNPSGYSSNDLAKISQIQADYDSSLLKSGVLKITRLEAVIDEIRLERRALAEPNVFELAPVRRAINLPPRESRPAFIPVRFQIEKVKLEMGKVVFQTQLGNDQVTENRKISAPSGELTDLTTPDSLAVYAVLLALRSAGWKTFLPTRSEVAAQVETQANEWMEQLKQKIQVLQTQLNQTIRENIGKQIQ